MKTKVAAISWTTAHNPFLDRVSQILPESFEFSAVEARSVINSIRESENRKAIKNKILKFGTTCLNLGIIFVLFLVEFGIEKFFKNKLKLRYTYRIYIFKKMSKIIVANSSHLIKIKNWGFPFNQIQEQFNIAKKIVSETDAAHFMILPEDNILYFSSIYIYLYVQ